MSIPSGIYNEYIHRIEYIVSHGTKQDLERLYAGIIAKYGRCDDLYRLDSLHNPKWRIL